jgi:hypothetical protein
MTRFTATVRQALQQAAAFALALGMTGVALVSLNHLATEQHAATMLAKAAAAQQQAQATAAVRG